MFFSRSKPAPPIIATDKIYPVHYWDDTHTFRSVVLYFLMRFDDRLDAKKLGSALSKLISKGDWCKLGARLRRNEKGKLEYHIPAHFDDQRPPISYYQVSHQFSISSHPLASQLPRASMRPQIVARGDDFVDLMRRPEDPECLEDYLYSDRPVLALHIVSFTDATLVTLSWTHVVLDGMGRKALLDAWSLMLQGREDEIPPLHGLEVDPLATLGLNSTDQYKHAGAMFGFWQMVVFGLRYAFDQIFWRPKDESRVICVPRTYLQSLKDNALADLTAAHDGSEGNDAGNKPFISDGDLLCAWMTRHILSCMSLRPNQTIAINIAFGLRWLLSEDLLPSSSAYVSNAVTYVPIFMTAKDAMNKSLGYVAASLRKALVRLGTREQIEARLALERSTQDRSGYPALFGDPWMHMVVCTNWAKGNFFDLDFSAAVIVEGPHQGEQKLGKPSYIQAHAFAKGFSLISGFLVAGKDAAGNYWLQSVLRREYWSVLEQKFAAKSIKGD